jgi:transmembrane sensor
MKTFIDMQQNQAKILLEKYTEGTATEEEKALLEAWYLQFEIKALPEPDELLKQNQLDRIRLSILEHSNTNPVRIYRLWPRIAAAASILFILSIGGYFLLHKQPQQQYAQNKTNDITPGSNKAILLSNGKKIVLTSAQNGQLAAYGHTIINKTQDGQVVYQASNASSSVSDIMVYDTLKVPRAGSYRLTLADGSKVWLNAATVLRYPEKFTGNERTVELISGEAYFAVVHNAKMPFRVVTNNQTVEDIGTEFNINAYPDEPSLKTTLISGSVQLSKRDKSVLLKPGQQAWLSNNSLTVRDADLEEVTAWKNGYFLFNNEDIKSLMKRISRWYDVEISYEGNITNEGFNGIISRNKNISQVLAMLEETNTVHFKINGRRISVTK